MATPGGAERQSCRAASPRPRGIGVARPEQGEERAPATGDVQPQEAVVVVVAGCGRPLVGKPDSGNESVAVWPGTAVCPAS